MNTDYWRKAMRRTTTFTTQSITNFQFNYHHEIKIANSKNKKMCKYSKCLLLSTNLWLEVPWAEIFRKFQNETVN